MDDDEKQNNLEIKGHSLWRFLLKKFENKNEFRIGSSIFK